MTLECRYCHYKLSTDDLHFRQKLRQHIAEKHTQDFYYHVRGIGALIDMLLFECPEDPARWKFLIEQVITEYLKP